MLKKLIEKLKQTEMEINETEEKWWANDPIFQDKNVGKLYEKYLLKAGHCPICNDFLFVDIEKKDVTYKVTRRCVNHKCNYEIDISREFNEYLGIKIPEEIEDKKLFQNQYHELVTNFLERNAYGERRRIWGETPKIKMKTVETLPQPSEDTLNCVYLIENDKLIDGYITQWESKWVWIKLGSLSSWSEFDIKYNINEQKYEVI